FISPVGVQLSAIGSYLPPVCKGFMPSLPPQISISLPVQTAVFRNRAAGTLKVLVGLQLSLVGLYRPPSVRRLPPPHTTISLPVHIALWPSRATGAFTTVVGVQLSLTHSKEEISGSLYISQVRALAAASAFAP